MLGGEGGAYLSIDPVVAHNISDEGGILRTITNAIITPNPIVPQPSRESWPKSVLLKAAGVKSQVALERASVTWFVACDGRQWYVYPSRWNSKGRWEADTAAIETYPAAIAPEELAQRVLDLAKKAIILG
jgi:hypothetical protein